MSMISHRIDELRVLEDWLRTTGQPRDALLVASAIDTIQALSEKVADQNLNRSEIPKSENPCGKCQMSLMEKSTCCGCPERIEWEKQYKQNIPSATSKNLKEPNKSCEVDDVIYKQAAIDTVSKCLEGRVYWRTIFDTKESLESLPSAQEIIRCKECKHRDPEDKKCDSGHSIRWQLPRDDNWFCADAERRTDE